MTSFLFDFWNCSSSILNQLTNGWLNSIAAGGLSFGSLVKHFNKKSLASLEIPFGRTGDSVAILCLISTFYSVLSHGHSPVNISKTTHPSSSHRAAKARNSVLCQTEISYFRHETYRLATSKMFVGFISQWT